MHNTTQSTDNLAGTMELAPQEDASPTTRAVIIGTGITVPQVQRQLEVSTDGLTLVGALLPPGLVQCAECADRGAELPPRLGDFDGLADVLRRDDIDQVLVSLPLSMDEQIRDITQALDQAKMPWRFLPTLSDMLAGTASFGARGVTISASAVDDRMSDLPALLDRQPRPLDEDAIDQMLRGRVVLITGAGGSIGSELARQAARFAPAKLVLVERSENALFEIDREIAGRYTSLARAAVLHDVTDGSRTRMMVATHRPDIIFHAAAHKHVPMMEDHPAEAVENNFYGTRSIVDAAAAQGVDRLVMISSDKAVNPTSVMGATKRLAELYIQHLSTQTPMRLCMVRFGNVLGSACSVLPIWTRQIAQGGPITITDPGMTRYFMTIPEAAGLVTQSAALCGHGQFVSSGDHAIDGARSGEIFVLDMGEPISIRDLAHRFLRMQGLEPDVDVRVIFTGARPGEKLHEELSYDREDMIATAHASIRLLRTAPPDAAHIGQIIETFDRLRQPTTSTGHAWDGVSPSAIIHALRAAVPEMIRAAAG